MTSITNYNNVYNRLTESSSELNTAKKNFEDEFKQFLCKYRPYTTTRVSTHFDDSIITIYSIASKITSVYGSSG
jgi:hypothetical protein